jgi:CheY-like chemotaxis protein
VDMMDRQLSHLVRLVDDLLDVGRISSGKLQLRREPLVLNRVLAASVESTRVVIEARQQELIVEDGDESLQVEGDFDRLAQVFNNLLSNAAKYTPAGGDIRLRQWREGERVRVEVADSGIGIPADDLPHVFDLFSQVRAHQGLTDGGLGIGLALVKSIVGLHGGEVGVHSEGPGKGSRFCVCLPLSAGREADEPEAAERRTEATMPRRILVADDSDDMAASLAQLLRLSGHQVWTARDGEEAVEVAERLRPDTVFLDLGMPRLDGLQAAARIRSRPWGASTLLIALTGWGQESDRQRTVDAGFDRHLVKPPDAVALENALERRDDARAELRTAAASSPGAGERRGSLR